mgnify:CR=1 FL=1
MWEDDEDDFEGMSDEEFKKQREEQHKRLYEMPIMKKAIEIRELTKTITELMNEELDQFELRSQMRENAYIIGPKIAGAQGSDSYLLSMENAVIIKRAARELQAETSLAKEMKLIEAHYLQLLRNDIEEFRLLFLEWIKTFDTYDRYDDGWGIFVEGA